MLKRTSAVASSPAGGRFAIKGTTGFARSAARLVLVVLAGLGTALFVATALCLMSIHISSESLDDEQAEQKLQSVSKRLDWPEQTISANGASAQIIHGVGFTHTSLTLHHTQTRQDVDGRDIQWTASAAATVTEYGWPLRCLIAENLAFMDAPLGNRRGDVLAHAADLARSSRAIAVPLVINFVIFCIAFWFLPNVPRQLRRAYRARQGRCPTCGYPRGVSTVCTECGSPLPSFSEVHRRGSSVSESQRRRVCK